VSVEDRELKKRIRELKRKERHGELSEKEEEELSKLEGQSDGPAPVVSTSAGTIKCPNCGESVEPDFIKCPACNVELKK
jgi:rubrerythrin